MIEPRTLSQLLADSAFDRVHTAIADELTRLLPGVKVVKHPGKLDINDVVAKQTVTAPGIMLGWSRARVERLIDGRHDLPIEWTAYVVATDHADVASRRAVPREAVAHAIGSAVLEILDDEDLSGWGIAGMDRPFGEPAPSLTPLFTARSFAEGAVFYAVTWAQGLPRRGSSLFGGATPEVREAGTGADVQLAGDELPIEIQALLRNSGDLP